MKFFFLIPLLLISAHSVAQDTFFIKEYIANDSFPALKKDEIKINKKVFFEDSLYIVSRTCAGEWGGSITFKNKKSGIAYCAASNCPVSVNKLNGKYYVTNTLAHLIGGSRVLEIDDPDSLTVLKLSEKRNKKGKVKFLYVDNNVSQSKIGTRQLVDSTGVLIVASFTFNGQLYHIVTDHYKTFLSKIDNGKLVTVTKVSENDLWTYNPTIFVADNNHLIVGFKNKYAKGHLDIFENQITVVRQK